MKKIVIIPAGGSGSRLGASTPKQFVEIKGIPIIIRTISAFSEMEEIDEIHLPAHKNYISYLRDLIEKFNIRKVKSIIEGGLTRQSSVYNALSSLSAGDEDVILIHDAVRPFVNKKLIIESLNAVNQTGACIPYVTPNNTIKIIEEGCVGRSLDRSKLASVQTPQVFKYGIIKDAFEYALKNNIEATDDSSLAELIGIQVIAIKGDRLNIKITEQIDLKIGELIMENLELAR